MASTSNSTGNKEVGVDLEGNVENKDLGNDPSAPEGGTADGAVPVNSSALGRQSLKDMTLPELRLESYAVVEKLKTLRREVKSKDNEVDPAINKKYLDLSKWQQEIEEEITVKLALEESIGKCQKEFDKLYSDIKCHVHMCFFKYKQDDLSLEPQIDVDGLSQFKADLALSYQKCKSLMVPTGEMNRKADYGKQMCDDMIALLGEVMRSPSMELSRRKALFKTCYKKNYAKSVIGSDRSSVASSIMSQSLAGSRISNRSEITKKRLEIDAQRKRDEIDLEIANLKRHRDLVNLEERLGKADLEEAMPPVVEDDVRSQASSQSLDFDPAFLYREREQAKPQPLGYDPHRSACPPQPQWDQHRGTDRSDASATVREQLSVIAATFAASVEKSRLPVPTPQIFDGDPLKFLTFKKSFEALIENKGVSSKDKIYYLQQYLTGRAKSIVEGRVLGNDEEAYQDAWTKLKTRFGQPHTIQQSLRNRLKEWPKIAARDGKALLEFSDLLHTLLDAMPHVEGLTILNDYLQIQDTAGKLPEWCYHRWTRYVTKTMNSGKPYPSFSEFTSFVTEEAQVMTNPICVPQSSSETKNRDKKQHKPPHIAHNSHAVNKTTVKSCSYCNDSSHPIWRCDKFKKIPYEQKIKCVSEEKLCFKCLNKGHYAKVCRKDINCSKCKKIHHTLMHRDKTNQENSKTPNESPTIEANSKSTFALQEQTSAESNNQAVDVETMSLKANGQNSQSCTSMILPVWVKTEHAGSQEVLTYALIDSQSDCTYITQDLADKINLPSEPVKMKVATLLSTSVIDCKKLCNIKIRGYDMNEEVCLKTCYTRENIPHNRSHIPSKIEISKMPYLSEIAPLIPPLQDCDVGLLIGYCCPQALRPVQTVTGGAEDAFAIKTDLGWSVVGGSSHKEDSLFISHRIQTTEVMAPPTVDIIRVLDQDFKDTNDDRSKISQDDLKFLQIMESGIRKTDSGKISMPLPIKDQSDLPNNYDMALARLKPLKRKLSKDEKFYAHYTEFMNKMLDNGFAEPVEPPTQGEIVNYIPHQGVYHAHKPDKIRIVFDGSAKAHGVALNDVLLKGPDLMNGLLGVLLRFRQEKIALTCDIEQMFYNFEVHEEHRNLLRFLWWPKGDLNLSPTEFRLTVHLFGAASSPGCANYGLKYLANEYKHQYPAAASFLTRNFYVDDGLQSLPNKNAAIDLVEQATNLCKKGNIRLHKFLSNDTEVINSIPPSERAASLATVGLELDALPIERTLGLRWDVKQDCFVFKVSLKQKPCTRRGILSSVMSVFDPKGFVSPVTLKGRQILQSICKQKTSWDESVDPQTAERWEQWKADIAHLEDIKIPRCVKLDKLIDRYELHHFSDASTSGYGQCSYLRTCYVDGSFNCVLLMSKARVAPSKVISIPRLELTAAFISVKISKLIKAELDLSIGQEYFWTDSKVVLGYIANDAKRFHVFVSNRVQYIRDNTEVDQWHHVPTKSNPADLASRGISARELSKSCWLQGPKFLQETDLPLCTPSYSLKLGDPEVRAQCFAADGEILPTGLLSRLIRFEKWETMVNALSVLLRKIKGKRDRLSENQEVADLIVIWVQNEYFAKEKLTLEKGETIPSSSYLANLCLMIDKKGILRVGGRIHKSQHISEGERHPIILPRQSHVTKVIITKVHNETNHGGRSLTLCELRTQGYYVHKGSKTVAKILNNCLVCRKIRRPPECQKMADLPSERVEQCPVFFHSGMDVFGPYMVKRGRSETKRYGLLFTCLYSRAIHLEMLEDLSTDCFINALRCFISLRGVVKTIFCDQGTNFVGAHNEMQQALTELEHSKLEIFLSSKQVEFKFNVPHASEQAGVWERQIRTTRSVLRSVIDFSNTRLDDSSLRTFFYEAAYIVNSRPLSPVSLNDPLAEPPVTPNALLHGKLEGVLPPPGAFCPQDVYARKRWRRVQYLSEQFWCKWKREYLLNQQQRQKWVKPRRNLAIGDIVLLKDNNVQRNQWPLALVIEAKEDQDGLVRKVKLRVSNNKAIMKGTKIKALSEMERPVQGVVLLIPTTT